MPPVAGTTGGATPAEIDPAIAALVPGVLPAEAAPAAVEAWKRVEAAAFVPGVARAPIVGFELELDVIYRQTAGGASNDLRAIYKFLAPGAVRIDLKDRATMRGPLGDWLEDRKLGQNVDLRVGREYEEDRRQLDDTLSIAKHFVALASPGSLRIASLESLPGPPASLPKAREKDYDLAKRAPALSWLSIRSPDFRLVGGGATAPMARATIGFDPATARVEIALVEEDRPAAGLLPSARMVRIAGGLAAQGYLVPRSLSVYGIEEGSRPPALTTQPGMVLYVIRADLAAKLAARDFQPLGMDPQPR
jgi:hypothetical protein